MVFLIARQRLISNLLTMRFSLSFVLCIALFATSTIILTGEYRDRVEEYNAQTRSAEANLREIPVFSELSVVVTRPPSPLSIICEGADQRLNTAFRVGFDQAPAVSEEENVRNPLLAVFPSFDGMGVVEIIIGLLVIFLAYDVISGQREQGTLRLVLSCGVSRSAILAGEFIGGMTTAALPLLSGFLVSVLILLAGGTAALTGRDFLTLGMLAVLSVLYLAVFFTLAMLFSTRIRRSATALILVLTTWVIVVFILPPAAVYIARRIAPVPAKADIDARAAALRLEWTKDMNRYAQSHPFPLRSTAGNAGNNPQNDFMFLRSIERERNVYTGDWPYAFRYYFGPREMVEWYRDGSVYGHRLRMEYEDRIWREYRDYLGKLEAQARIARILSALSPSFTFYRSAAHLSRTSEAGYLSFIDDAAAYRTELIRYMREKNGLDSHLLFTQKPPEAFPTAGEILALKDSRGEKAVRELMDYPVRPLDLGDIPRFSFDSRSIARGVSAALPGIISLLVMSILFFTAAWALFLRADVR